MDGRWKWFKNCLRALDGTYIRVKVSEVDKPRYRNRKGEITTNVLAACSQDMQFIYVLPGWEGSAADGRVLRDAVGRKNGLKVPKDSMSSKHVWTPDEDEKLVEAMLKLEEKGTHNNNEKGGFVKGHQKVLEKMLKEKLPGHDLKKKHISSCCKTLKKIRAALYDLINKGSGFGWDKEKKIVVAPTSVWNEYIKSS
ncbi:hypothetical protein DITRI_Ditri18aG0009100 [Diplodiscus trichospermus]